MAKSNQNITYKGYFLEMRVEDWKEVFSSNLSPVIPSINAFLQRY